MSSLTTLKKAAELLGKDRSCIHRRAHRDGIPMLDVIDPESGRTAKAFDAEGMKRLRASYPSKVTLKVTR